MKKLLITGSSGFIGKYFIKNYGSKYNLQTFSFRSDDFNELVLNNIDVVLHLSALVHQMGGASREEYERINVNQTLVLAEKAKVSGVNHFVFMSTVKVYGEETNCPYTEQSECYPEDDYGKTKLKAEQALKQLETDTFKVSIIRTPVVYGHGVKANIKNLVWLVNKVPILPFGGIENRRSLVYIGNLCQLIDTIIDRRISGVFLAGDDVSLSTTALIQLISNALHKKVVIVKFSWLGILLKMFKQNFYRRLYESLEIDNTMTKELLGFENIFTTEDGIQLMISGE